MLSQASIQDHSVAKLDLQPECLNHHIRHAVYDVVSQFTVHGHVNSKPPPASPRLPRSLSSFQSLTICNQKLDSA